MKKDRFLAVGAAALCGLLALGCRPIDRTNLYDPGNVEGKAGMPYFEPPAGSYSGVQQVAIGSNTDGATIRYTVDGTTPGSGSPVLASGSRISVSSTGTLKAYAVKSGLTDSDAATAAYTIAGGSVSGAKDITAFSFKAADNAGLASDVAGVIGTNDITATLPLGSSRSSLKATFTTTGASLKVGGVTQTSGTTANDFTSTVTYTVTAGDATTKDYAVTVGVTLAAPGSVQAVFLSTTSLRVGWSAVSGADGYNVYRSSTQTGTYSKLNSSMVAGVSYDDTGLTVQTTYWYKVVAVKGTMEQTLSAASSGGTIGYWARAFGTAYLEDLRCVQPTSDGGYIACGGANPTGTAGSGVECRVMKLKGDGSVEWLKSYGTANGSIFMWIQQTTDGGYVAAGPSGDGDARVLKLDSAGAITWQKVFGGTSDESCYYVLQTSDGGYMVDAMTKSYGSAGGLWDVWLLKLDSGGGLTWQKTYGSPGSTTGNDNSYCLQQTSDGGYIVCATSDSFSDANGAAWLFKTDSAGAVTWQYEYPASGLDCAMSVLALGDGYLISGRSTSFGSDWDGWMFKVNLAGNSVTWSKTYGTSSIEGAITPMKTSDGGFICGMGGISPSDSSDEVFVLKLDSAGVIGWQKAYGGSGSDSAGMVMPTSDGRYVVTAGTYSFGSGGTDWWILSLPDTGALNGATFVQAGDLTALATSIITPTVTSITPGSPTVSYGDGSWTAADKTLTVVTQYP